MEKEDIFIALEAEGLQPKYINFTNTGYSREIEFNVFEQTYFIIWFRNMSTLSIGKQRLNQFRFTSIRAANHQVYCARALLFKYGNDDNEFSICIKKNREEV